MRWVELFEADNKRLSMMRLTMFLSFFPASYVIINETTETMLGLYLGAYVTGYLGGKFADVAMAPKQLADSSDSDTVSDTAITDTVVAKRSVKSTRTKKRPF